MDARSIHCAGLIRSQVFNRDDVKEDNLMKYEIEKVMIRGCTSCGHKAAHITI